MYASSNSLENIFNVLSELDRNRGWQVWAVERPKGFRRWINPGKRDEECDGVNFEHFDKLFYRVPLAGIFEKFPRRN